MVYRRRTFRRRTFRRPYRRTSRRRQARNFRRRRGVMRTTRIPTRLMADRTMIRFTDKFSMFAGAWTQPLTAGTPFTYTTVQANSIMQQIIIPDGPNRFSYPTGLEQWGGFYSRYIVNYSRIKVTPIGWRGDNTAPIRVTILPLTQQNFDELSSPEELPMSRSRIFSGSLFDRDPSTDEYTLPSSSNTLSSVRNQCYIKRLFGQTNIITDDAYWGNLTTDVTAHPFKRAQFVIYTESMVPYFNEQDEEVFTPSPLIYEISITYNVVLGDRRMVADTTN